jgi:hypothetical protein
VQSSSERLAYLEGRAEEQGRMVDVIRDGMAGLAARIDGLDARLSGLDVRMDSLDARMATFETRIVGLEERVDRRFEQVDRRFIGIDERLDRMSGQLSNLIMGVAVAAVSGVLGMITAMVR